MEGVGLGEADIWEFGRSAVDFVLVRVIRKIQIGCGFALARRVQREPKRTEGIQTTLAGKTD